LRKILVSISLIFIFSLPIKLSAVGQENEWQESYNQSFEYFYNWQFNKAIECLERARELNPYNPAIYWRLTYVFWVAADDETTPKNRRKELEKMFNEVFDKGVAICENLLNSDSDNPEILFYLGGLYGNRVFFKTATGSRNKSLLTDINKVREYLEKIDKTENFYYEARGYLGIFNYSPVLMSGTKKFLVRKFGYKWDGTTGLIQVKEAMQYSRYSDDVKFLYKGILIGLVRKKEYQDRISEAINLVEELIKKYPRNPALQKDWKTLKNINKK